MQSVCGVGLLRIYPEVYVACVHTGVTAPLFLLYNISNNLNRGAKQLSLVSVRTMHLHIYSL